mgnify:CR=1 FL=1
MIIIMAISFLLVFFCFLQENRKNIEAWTMAVLSWCTALFLKTEILSCFQLMNRWIVFAFWLLVTFIAGVVIWKTGKYALVKNAVCNCGNTIRKNKFFTVVFLLITVLAIITVPYNWDSMTYHLPRVAYWAENHSVAHYATTIYRQVGNPPMHEFISLDVYLLMGNTDYLLNLIQCGAYLTNAWLVYEIATKIGCSSKAAKVGMLLFCSTPIVFAEALTTQNDNLACLFLLIFVYGLLDFLDRDKKIADSRENYVKCMCLAACVGLGYLTKPTVSMGMAVFAVFLLVMCILRRDSIKTLFKLVLVTLPIMAMLLFPETLRNINTYDAIYPSSTGASQLVSTLDPRYLFINGVKNYIYNFPNVYVENGNAFLERGVRFLARKMGVDINAECISEGGGEFQLRSATSYGHDTAVNVTILVLFTLCLLWSLYRRKVKGLPKVYTYCTAALFFCLCIFMRWNPYVTRYMLPYLVLMCPMIAFWCEDMSLHAGTPVIRESVLYVVGWMGILGLITMFSYHGQTAKDQHMSRPGGYFTNRYGAELGDEYRQVCDAAVENNDRYIGLILNGDAYEYPMQYLLQGKIEKMQHIMVDNPTAKYEDPQFDPDGIITTENWGDTIVYKDRTYTLITDCTVIYLYQGE